eukprot:1161201-Pelagomonas_calceolata.AAC.6
MLRFPSQRAENLVPDFSANLINGYCFQINLLAAHPKRSKYGFVRLLQICRPMMLLKTALKVYNSQVLAEHRNYLKVFTVWSDANLHACAKR